ncbi:MAG: NAD(P)-dependent oxidoreductase [Bdellovibrionales bacterium]
MRRYAVIGSTGFLGQTFFRRDWPGVDLVPIDRQLADLTKPFEKHLGDVLKRHQVEAAIVCAAMSSPDDCKRDPDLSHKVNVSGMIRLFDLLKKLKIKPVFFSTDHVFDGQKGNYSEEDAYNPITLYGRQKVEAESYLRQNFTDYLILRTSKQVAMRKDKKNILSQMTEKLRSGQPIRCATDHSIAPAFVEDIASVTLSALKAGLSGIYHITPGQTFTRFELGQALAEILQAPATLVEPCSIQDFQFLEVRPPVCTLNNQKLVASLSPRFTDLASGVRRL